MEGPPLISAPVQTNAEPLANDRLQRVYQNGKKDNNDRSQMENRVEDSRLKPHVEALRNQETWPPDITPDTRMTMARVMARQYKGMVSVMEKNSAYAPPEYLKHFQKFTEGVYQRTFSNGDVQSASQEELMRAFMAELNNEEAWGYGNAFIEMQQQAFQASTGVKSEVAKKGFMGGLAEVKLPEYIPPVTAIAEDGTAEVATQQHIKRGRFTWNPIVRLNRAFGGSLSEQRGKLKQQGRLNQILPFKNKFPDKPTFNMERTINGISLDPVQQEILRQMEELGKIPQSVNAVAGFPDGRPLTEAAVKEVNAELTAMIAARRNFYNHRGAYFDSGDLNTVNVMHIDGGGVGIITELPASTHVTQLGDIEMIIGAQSQADRESFLKKLGEKLAIETSEKIDEAVSRELTLGSMRDQITVLEREVKGRELNLAEKDKRKGITDEKDKITNDGSLIDAYETADEAWKAKDDEVTQLTAEVNPDYETIAKDKGAGSQADKKDEVEKHKSDIAALESKEKALASQYTQVTTALASGIDRDYTSELGDIDTNIQRVEAQVAGLVAAKAGLPINATDKDKKVFDDKIHALNLQLNKISERKGPILADQAKAVELRNKATKLNDELNDPTTGIRAKLKNAQDEKRIAEAEVVRMEKILTENRENYKKLKTAEKERDRLRVAKDKQRAAIDARAIYTAGASVEDLRKERDEKIKDLQGQIETIDAVTKPDWAKERQLRVLRLYRDNIETSTAHDNIRNRGNQRPDSVRVRRQLDEAARLHPGYQEPYLRTLNLLFSDTVFMDTVEGRTLFDTGSKMVTPETFSRIVMDYCNTRTPRIPVASFSVNSVNSEFAKYTLEYLRKQVRARELGKLPPGIETSIRQVEKVKADDILQEREELRKEEELKGNEYRAIIRMDQRGALDYVEGEASIGRPWVDIAAHLNTTFYGDTVLNEAQAKDRFKKSRELFEDKIRELITDPAVADPIIAQINTSPPTSIAGLLAIPTFAPNTAEITQARDFALVAYDIAPEPETVQNIAEIVAANREAESIQLFYGAVKGMIMVPAHRDRIRNALVAGTRIEVILKEPALQPYRTLLDKANVYAHSGDTLVAGIMYFARPEERSLIERTIKEGKTIGEAIKQIQPPRRAEFRAYLRECIAHISNPAITAEDLVMRDGMTNTVIDRAKARKPGLSATGTDPVLSSMMESFEASEEVVKLEESIDIYMTAFPYYESVNHLALLIMKDSPSIPVKRAKMIAMEIDVIRKSARPVTSSEAVAA